MRVPRIIWQLLLGIVVVVCAAIGMSAWVLHDVDEGRNPCGAMRSYSAERWRRLGARPSIGAPDRACITADLIAQGFLLGRTPREVVDSLGLPSSRTWESTPALAYYVGNEREGWGLGMQWLVLRLDSTNRVRSQGLVVSPD